MKIEGLIIHASINKIDRYKISHDSIFSLLIDFEYENENLGEINNLLIIFLLIFIQYESDKGVDSNTLAYGFCEIYEKQINKKLQKCNLDSTVSHPLINHYEFILRELSILKVWSFRRSGHRYDNFILKQSENMHNKLKSKYPDDYRFLLSEFLIHLNYVYSFKKANKSNINVINIYVDDLIKKGEKCGQLIIKTDNYSKYSYLLHSYKTIINSLSFVYCIRLDLLLFQNKREGRASKKSVELYSEINRLKLLRKSMESKIEQPYLEKIMYQPVFPYVESYIEYLESFMIKGDENRMKKLYYAGEAIKSTLDNLSFDEKNREFFVKCCKKLQNLIKIRESCLTNDFESFILDLDEIRISS